MMAKQRFSHGENTKKLVLAVTFSFVIHCLFATGQAGASELAGYKIFPLKHISVEQGKKYLAEVGISTVSHFPGSAALLVTAGPHELTKAKALLGLVDGPEEFVIKAILPITAARSMPSNEQIAAKLAPDLTGDISIGSFSNPPGGDASVKAIIDIHNDAVISVAPVGLLEKIVSVIGQLPDSADKPKVQDKLKAPVKPKAPKPAEPNEQGLRSASKDKTKTLPKAVAALLEQKESMIKAQEQKALEQKIPKQKTPEPGVVIQRHEPTAIDNEDEVVNLVLPEKLTIVGLLGLVGPYLQLDFMYDPKLLVGEVTINPNGKFKGPVKVKDLYPLLEEVLKFKSLAMTRGKGNLVAIVPAANALDIDPVLLVAEKDQIERGDVIVTRVFELEHIDTASATNLLNAMKLSIGPPIIEGKTLIVTGYAHRMARIKQLLDMVDKPGEPRKFKFRQLQFTMAQTLAPKIQTLAEQLGTISITISATAPASAPPSPQRQGETTAQYQLRLRRERETRLRGTRARQPATPSEQAKPSVYLDADERTNRILMIGLEEQLTIVEKLVDTLDVAQQDLRTLALYKIDHVDAEGARMKLEELGIIGVNQQRTDYSRRITGGIAPTAQKPGTTRPQPLSRTQRGSATTESLVDEPQVIVIEPTNSLLVNATAEQHTKIAKILEYVDSETQEDEMPVKLYPLENQSPDHLTEVLTKLIEETVKDKEGKVVEQVISKQDEQITIVPDPNTYSLIVSASKKNQKWIEDLIKKLDKRRPQVLIDVTLVEISEVDAFDYDLQLVTKFPRLEPGGQMDFLAPLLSPEGSGLPSTRIAETTSILGDGFASDGFYADTHIQALLSLMQKKGYGRVLAKPKILVNDNELGHIDTTNTIYVSRSASTVVSSTGGQTPPISTSFTFDEFPSGIQLDITPHISKGYLLRLEIKMVRSSQAAPEGGIEQNEPPPDKSENNIETTVTVPDKSTIILGGIIQLDQAKNNWKVPLLGDIPVVGGLFRKIDNSSRQTRLYVFVKANILRPDETLAGLPDLEDISEKNRVAFESFEEKFQNYYDWPGIKPKPMEPLKVLDAQ